MTPELAAEPEICPLPVPPLDNGDLERLYYDCLVAALNNAGRVRVLQRLIESPR